jgi:hypothetical protein
MSALEHSAGRRESTLHPDRHRRVTLTAGFEVFALGYTGAQRGPTSTPGSARPDCGAMWTGGLVLEGVVGNRQTQAYVDMDPLPGVLHTWPAAPQPQSLRRASSHSE